MGCASWPPWTCPAAADEVKAKEVTKMNGCMCGCRSWRPGAGRWPTREDQVSWLQDYQRDLEQQAADVADEIRRLQEGQQSAS